jgi:hypothetical protein
MRKSYLTQEELKLLLDYSPETGHFSWRGNRRGVAPWRKTGNIRPDGYLRICVNRVSYLGHRLAWLYVTGEWPQFDIDHIDGNPLNNAFANLRDVAVSSNVQNIKKATQRNSSSKLLGVSYHNRDKLWRARIMVKGKNVTLGYFKDKEKAHEAYLEAKRKLHDGCTI